MRRRLYKLLLFAALGLATTLAVAWLVALLVDVQQGRQTRADSYDDGEHWTVMRWDRAGAAQITSTRVRGTDVPWSPQQVAGPPDCPTMGDQHKAWASLTTNQAEWLILEYPKAVIPREVNVYENYTPGALSKVTIFDEKGEELVAWTGVDPTPVGLGSGNTPASRVPISLNVPTKRVKIYLASDKIGGWNEIDAVGLIDDKKQVQWAKSVKASSTYASVSYGSSSGIPGTAQATPEELTPFWSGLAKRTQAMEDGQINSEERRVDARGWPMLALRSETLASGAQSGAATTVDKTSVDLMGSSPVKGGRNLTYTASTVSAFGGGGTFAVTTPSAAPAPVPLRPIWIGLMGDTAFYGIIWFGLWAALVVPRRFFREVARFRQGSCIRCGYDLGYDFVRGCPECGWRRDRQIHAGRTLIHQPTNGDRS